MSADSYRERLYDIFSQPEVDVTEKVDSALELGTEYLDAQVGFYTRIKDGRQEIVHVTGEDPLVRPGETCPLEDAYCRRTVEIESTLSVQDAADSTAISQVAIDRFGLGSYVGARIIVDDETYGTICFADEQPRESPFTDAEEYFVELLAGLVGQAIEQREYQQKLKERETRLEEQRGIYNAVVESSFDLVFRIDTDGEFTYISPAIEGLLGYSPEELIGNSFIVPLPDAEARTLSQEMFEQVMTGETVEQQYLPLQHKNERRVFVDVRLTPIYDDTTTERTPENIVAAQGTARDATDRFRRNRLIRVLNRVLRHNLRNDITVVQGFAETLQRRVDGEAADYAGRIVNTSERLIALSETARKLEETLQAPPEIESRDIVPSVSRAGSQIAEKYDDATVRIETPERAIAESAPRLETAVWELADNAAKHSGDAPTITLSVAEDDDIVSIQVADDGCGLPDQEREVLLSGEETPLVHGNGLGLWLVHWIVESIGGELQATDTASGTCIEIAVPKAAESESD